MLGIEYRSGAGGEGQAWPMQGSSAQPTCVPTHNGEDDNHEVEDVPAVGEVVVAQGSYLDNTLACEDGDKKQVDLGQDVDLLRALVICLHHHGHHVQADEKHDGDIEGLLGHNVEHEALVLVLKGGAEDRLSRGLRESSRPPPLVPLSPERPPSRPTLQGGQRPQKVTGRGRSQDAGQPGSPAESSLGFEAQPWTPSSSKPSLMDLQGRRSLTVLDVKTGASIYKLVI